MTATSLAPGGFLPPGAVSYQLTFDRPMKVGNLSSDDFRLHGNLLGVNYTATSYSYDASGTVLTLNYSSLPEDNHTLTHTSGLADGANFTDTAGNPLDGEFTGTFPSGNGLAGGDFSIGWALDIPGPESYPTPLTAKSPLGSLVYDSSIARTVAFSKDSDNFTINVASGQTLTVVTTPTDAGLQPSVRILDSSNTQIASVTASAAGRAAVLNAVPATTGGTYTIVVTGVADTTGRYSVQLILNAFQEEEGVLSGVTNGTIATAENINSSFFELSPLATSAQRGAVIGVADSIATYDFYSFSLLAGEAVTLALGSANPANLNLVLQDSTGAILAVGSGGTTNLNQLISRFVVVADGIYYARISGDALTNYCLVVTRDADFDTEPNNTYVTPQLLDGTQGVVGRVQTMPISTTARVGYYTDFNTGDTGPQAPILAAGYSPVQITNISTFDFSTIDIFMVDESSNTGISSTLAARLPVIQTWVQRGGVIVVHDRFVAAGSVGSNQLLIGTSGAVSHHDATYGTDLNVIPPGGTLVTSGPFGSIGNSTLDGDTSSNQGWVDVFKLPSTTVPILSAGPSVSNAAGFSYELGAGTVYYATIPLDYYLDGSGLAALRTTIKNVYTPNVLAYANSKRRTTDDDWYSMTIAAGNRITLGTSTPGDGGGVPGNTLPPLIQLYDPLGNLVAAGTVGADGRNSSLDDTALSAGLYRVRVSAANGTQGEYFLAAQASAIPASDYNVVDAVVFTDWADTLGSLTQLRAGGGNSASAIDQVGFDRWRSLFSAPTLSPTFNSLTVPVAHAENIWSRADSANAALTPTGSSAAFDLVLRDWIPDSAFHGTVSDRTNMYSQIAAVTSAM